MALIVKNNPQGIDAVINQLQTDLYNQLTNKFGWSNYESYHRAYRNAKGGDKLPEVYIGADDYKEVLFDDKFTVTSFFLADDKRSQDSKNGVFTQGVSIIFQANLSELFPNVAHRADEELIQEVIKAAKSRGWESRMDEVITGVDNVYASLKIASDKKYLDDMSNFFMVRFNFKMLYSITNCTISAIK